MALLEGQGMFRITGRGVDVNERSERAALIPLRFTLSQPVMWRQVVNRDLPGEVLGWQCILILSFAFVVRSVGWGFSRPSTDAASDGDKYWPNRDEHTIGHICFGRLQVFDRRSAVKSYRILAVEHGTVNSNGSCYKTSCDGAPVHSPCYTASFARCDR